MTEHEGRSRPRERSRSVRGALLVFVAWALLVAGALAGSLWSLRHDDFDGLDNLGSFLLALPWALAVPAVPGVQSLSDEAFTVVLAGLGWLNGAVMAAAFHLVRRRGSTPS